MAEHNNAAIAMIMEMIIPVVGVCTVIKSDTAVAALRVWFKTLR